MTKLYKEKGYRLNGLVPNWKDRFGRGGGKIIKLIPLPHLGVGRHQIVISNGDILTTEYILDKAYLI